MSLNALKKHVLLLSLVMSAVCLAAKENTLTIGLIGDSTVASTYGWGPSFAHQFNDQTTVLNFAKNGATLESLSTKLDELLEQHPDYVLIQFGHNDQKKYGTEDYAEKLTSYVERVKKAGSQAVVLSSVTRRNFDENGTIKPRTEKEPGKPLHATLPVFGQTVQAVAEEQNVPFIDLYTLSVAHHNRIGPEASAAYNFNETDTTHFSEAGADAIAALVIAELKAAVPEIAGFLK